MNFHNICPNQSVNYKNKKILRQMVRHRAPDNFQVQGVFNSSFLKVKSTASNLLLFCTTVGRSVCTHIIFDIYFQEYLICNNSLQHSSMFYRLCATWVSHFRRTLDNLINKILNNTSVKFEGSTGILNWPQKKSQIVPVIIDLLILSVNLFREEPG